MKTPTTRLGRWLAAILSLAAAATAGAWEMQAYCEFFRIGPDGRPLATDVHGSVADIKPLWPQAGGPLVLRCPRSGYASFHLAVQDAAGGPFRLAARTQARGVQIDLSREWFHASRGGRERIADLLLPVRGELRLPDADMKIDDQKAAVFWVDVWAAKDTPVGRHEASIELTAGGRTLTLPLALEVLELTVPDQDVAVIDSNSYGWQSVGALFPARQRAVEQSGREWLGSDEFFRSLQEIHRYFYEHRATFHQLGYGHSGRVYPHYAPELAGSGRQRHVASWESFDKHFGPLCDGSAFAGTRRGPRPVEGLYLPINPEWPADWLHFGQPGYEVEFVNVVREMEAHFRQKGWTKTCFEMFFNHKKRYKAFEWDGDEARFPQDLPVFKYYRDLLNKAVPKDSPVQFRFRADASWLMRRQFDELAGVVDFWVCSGGIFAFYPEAPALLKKRGDKVWLYGGAPSAYGPLGGLVEIPLSLWMKDVNGVVYWNTTSQGRDPWFSYDGGRQCTVYSGGHFGLDELVAPLRMKITRNAVQDVNLLDLLAGKLGGDEVRKHVAALGGSTPDAYWHPDAPSKQIDPWEWSNRSIYGGVTRTPAPGHDRDGRWWLDVRQYIYENLNRSANP